MGILLITPSDKLPRDTPSMPCAILHFPDTCETRMLHLDCISNFLRCSTRLYKIGFKDVPL
jgi:hypothetical protein